MPLRWSILLGLLWVAFLLTALLPDEPLSIRVTPQTLFEGGSVQVVCFVAHHELNRALTLGLDGFSSSGMTLDGERAPFITTRRFDHVPCGIETAYCQLERMGRAVQRKTAPVVVTGCEP